jgi:hypothetical protein
MVKLKLLYSKYTSDDDSTISPDQFRFLLKDLHIFLPEPDIEQLCEIMGDITYDKLKQLFNIK